MGKWGISQGGVGGILRGVIFLLLIKLKINYIYKIFVFQISLDIKNLVNMMLVTKITQNPLPSEQVKSIIFAINDLHNKSLVAVWEVIKDCDIQNKNKKLKWLDSLNNITQRGVECEPPHFLVRATSIWSYFIFFKCALIFRLNFFQKIRPR